MNNRVGSVLIVDDSADDREFIRRHLEKDGFVETVLEAGTPESAIALASEHSPDCIFLDYRMPGQDGLVTISELRRTRPHSPIVMLTGEGNETVAARAIDGGAKDYLIKSEIGTSEIRRVMLRVIEKVATLERADAQADELRSFTRVLMHDIRNPLRSVTSFIELLREDIRNGDTDSLDENFDYIDICLRRMTGLINDLERYSISGEENEMKGFALASAVKGACVSLDNVIRQTAAVIELDGDADLFGCPSQITQLLQNLIGNSIKYCEEVPHIRVSGQTDDEGFCEVSVSDNGIGIPEQYRERIFEPFERLFSRDIYEGTGLGLATCRKLVQRHGGRIWCEENPGGGTRVIFTTAPISSNTKLGLAASDLSAADNHLSDATNLRYGT